MGKLIAELRKAYGENAEFREGQREAIEAVLNKKRLLVVQKTGWGKSLVYFLATKILRQMGCGITFIISLVWGKIYFQRNYQRLPFIMHSVLSEKISALLNPEKNGHQESR